MLSLGRAPDYGRRRGPIDTSRRLSRHPQPLNQILIVRDRLRELPCQFFALPSLRQLNERITVRYDLKPLAREDIRSYIEHRMIKAGGDKNSSSFTTGSYDSIYRLSRGIPRRINAICDRALLIAYGRDLRTIDRRLIRAAVRDIGPGYLTRTDVLWRNFRILRVALLAAILILTGGVLWLSWK